MTNDDYMADLDAVNIAARIKDGNNAIDVVTQYYLELENGQNNRAKEFKYNIGDGDANIGLYMLISEANKYYEFLEENSAATNEVSLEDRKALVRRFFTSIFNEYNYLSNE